jgi:ketosteroid isomerase-like protein
MTESDIERLEDERRAAMLANDIEALNRLLADDVTWVHASSSADDKGAFVGGFASGRLQCLSLEFDERHIRIFGDTALVSGLLTMDAMVAGHRRKSTSRFVGVWIDGGEGPKLRHWQTTRLPDV